MKLSNVKLDYHRNGICGNGFYVATFDSAYHGEINNNMVAIIFEEEGNCAVLNIDKLSCRDIESCSNSWRGDNFEPALRKEIEKYRQNLYGGKNV